MTAAAMQTDGTSRGVTDAQAVRLVLRTACPVAGCVSKLGTECNPPHPGGEDRKRAPFFHVARVARAFEALR